MNPSEFTASAPADIPSICSELIPAIIKYRFAAFDAEMGAGKTTFIKEICLQLGVHESQIGSPTFSIVNEYQGQPERIFHFDFYRLKNIEEAWNIGIEDYFSSGAICLMEWPALVEALIPKPYLHIGIKTEGESRIISATVINF
jgi:tRNA threonylcarbamoyladenosine biosynthesis protein TsaE